MAEVNTDKGGQGGKGKPKKLSTRIDLTPMVDLGFLLITFFMLATSMAKPQTMEISMPSKEKVKDEEQNKVKASKAMTILLAKENKVYYYFGTTENGVDPEVFETSFDSEKGIRKILLERNKTVNKQVDSLKTVKVKKKLSPEEFKSKLTEIKANKDAVVVLIKPSDVSNYQNLVDILDEMQITNIGRYAIVPISSYDTGLVEKTAPDAFKEPTQNK
jgi:biopolymer transport protein ExbD